LPHQPQDYHPEAQFEPPSADHWLGTDQFGRDVFSRMVSGGRQSLGGAALATAIALFVGTGMGAVAGGIGGTAEWGIMRLVDVLLSLPGLLLAMVLVALLGVGLWPVALGVGLSLAPLLSRVVRAAILSVRTEPFVEAARALGAGRWHLIWRHLFPNVAELTLSWLVVTYAWSLLNFAALEYLGLAGSPSLPSWGRMLNEGRAFLPVAPWIALGPGTALCLSVLAVMGISDSLRDTGTLGT
jgi:peptide/nickel transport system permease protein